MPCRANRPRADGLGAHAAAARAVVIGSVMDALPVVAEVCRDLGPQPTRASGTRRVLPGVVRRRGIRVARTSPREGRTALAAWIEKGRA
jgi:hypothetical protein